MSPAHGDHLLSPVSERSGAWRTGLRARALIRWSFVEELLLRLGFAPIGEVVDQRMEYLPDAEGLAGKGGAVYVFVNPDGRVWKVGMTRKGFSRVDYTRVFDGRGMKRPHEQRKLHGIRREVSDGARQWVLQTDQPELIESMLACMLNPTESGRQVSQVERVYRALKDL